MENPPHGWTALRRNDCFHRANVAVVWPGDQLRDFYVDILSAYENVHFFGTTARPVWRC